MIPPAKQEEVPSTRRSFVYAFGQRWLAFVLQLGTSIILARLLTPAESGIFSLAAAAIAVAGALREFGVSDYLMSQREVDEHKLRAAYTVTIAAAWTIALLLFLVAGPIGRAYAEPGVTAVIQLLSLNFALIPIGATSMALMTKQMRFDRLFQVNSASAVVGAIVTVSCAWAGASYMSPAWGSIASIATTFSLLLALDRQHVLMRPTFRGTRAVFRFGGTVTLAKFIDSLSSRCDDFILSGFLGFHASGLNSKANSLNSGFYAFFASAVISVATPMLAKSRDANTLSETYKTSLSCMTALQWLYYAIVLINEASIVHLLFGATWLEAAPLVMIGAVVGMLYAPFSLCNPVLTVSGKAKSQLGVSLAFGASLAGCLMLGAQFGLTAAIATAVLAHFVRLAALHHTAHRAIGIGALELFNGLRASLLICLAAGLAGLLLRTCTQYWGLPNIAVLAASSISSLLVFALVTYLTRHPLIDLVKHRFQAKAHE
jgi:O-antigen/teichoic acid export membrane protein